MTVRLEDFPARFREKVEVLPSGCWKWTAATNGPGFPGNGGGEGGYPYYWYCGGMVRAHRFAWAYHHGESPTGYDLHHTCELRACVHPLHVTPVNRTRHMKIHGTLDRD